MVIAFVLDRMSNAPDHSRIGFRREIEDERMVRIPGLRLEISSRIFLAALPLIAIWLVFGFTVAGEHKLLVAGLITTHRSSLSSADVMPWTSLTWVLNWIAGGLLLAWTYLIVGDFIRTGSFDPARCWRALVGNRLRLAAAMFAVFAGVWLLKSAVLIAGVMMFVPKDGPSNSFTMLVLVHFGLNGLFNLLHLILSAAAVGIVLDAVRRPTTG